MSHTINIVESESFSFVIQIKNTVPFGTNADALTRVPFLKKTYEHRKEI